VTLRDLVAPTLVALLIAATAFGVLTVVGRAVRRAADSRRARLAAPARTLLIRITAGDDDAELVDRLAGVDPTVWRAIEPTAVDMLGKVRGEGHAALVTVFGRRGSVARAISDLRARSAVRRARAAELLGNLGDIEAVPGLLCLLDDKNPDVRVVATRALGRVRDPHTASVLLNAAAGRHRIPAQLIAHSVIRLGPSAQAEASAALDDPRDPVRATALEVLGQIGATGSTARVEAVLRSDPSDEVRQRAARALGRLGTRSALDPLLAAVEPGHPSAIRVEAAHALGEVGSPAAADRLAALLTDPDYRVAHAVAGALLLLGKAGRAALVQASGKAPPAGSTSVRDLCDPAVRAGAHAREALARDALAGDPLREREAMA
jgi:HEAT repeat protein